MRTRTRARGRARNAPYRKKKQPTVAKVMKLIKQQTPETKIAKYDTSADFNSPSGEIKTWNLMYHSMSQGTGETQFIGKKFRVKGIEIKWQINNTSQTIDTSGYSFQHQRFLISVCAVKKYVTSSNLSLSDIEDTALVTNSVYRMNYDPEKIKILKQRKVNFSAILGQGQSNPPYTIGGIPQQKCGKFYVKLNKVLEFQQWNTTYELRDWNYYVMFHCGSFGNSGLIKSGEFFFSSKLYFTDA